MRSATGYQLERAELYAIDKEGNRIAPPGRGMYEMPVKETRAAPNSTHGLEDREQESLDRARIDRVIAGLSPTDREVLRLQETGTWDERDLELTPAEVDPLRTDPTVIEIGELRRGVHVVKRRFWRTLTHAQIAEQLGITPRQVHSSVVRTNRALRGASR